MMSLPHILFALQTSASTNDAIGKAKDFIGVVKDLVTIVTLSVGGWFAYSRFVRGQPLATRANLTQVVYSKRLDSVRTLVQVQVAVENTGERVLRPAEGYTHLQQILPVPPVFSTRLENEQNPMGPTKTEIDWPEIAHRDYPLKEDELTIHPGESAHLYCEFLIAADVETVLAYSLLSPAAEDEDLGWDVNTYHDITRSSERERPPCS